MSLLSLRESCRLYERKARKQRKAPPSMADFNTEHKTSLPTSTSAERAHKQYLKQLARAKKIHGVPLNARVPSLYKALSTANEAQLKPKQFENTAAPVATRQRVPEVRAPKIGRIPRVEESVSQQYQETKAKADLSDAALEAVEQEVKREAVDPITAYKAQLSSWLESHPKSKLHKTTQVVHFVDDRVKDFSPESTAAKMTQNQVALLKHGGGEFKMRSGVKKQYLDLLEEDVRNILSMMKKNIKGPYFVRVI